MLHELLNDQVDDLHKRLNLFAHEQRRLVGVAADAHAAIKTGNVGLTGVAGSLLDHALSELRVLADRAAIPLRPASEMALPLSR